VLQTVFLRMLRRSRNAEPLENPESYLRRAAINAALDVIRARQGDQTVPLPEESSGLMPAAPTQVDVSGLRGALSRAIAQLKPMQAEIFALRFLEGLSNRQIAQSLGISQVRVAVIVHRTRLQLRKDLRPYLSSASSSSASSSSASSSSASSSSADSSSADSSSTYQETDHERS